MSISKSVIATAAAAVVALAGFAVWRMVGSAPPPPVLAPLRVAFPIAEGLTLGAGPDHPFGIVLTSDGRRAVFPAARQGVPQLWLHDFESGSVDPLPATDGAVQPFFAADGTTVGFFSGGRLRTIRLDTREIADLADAPVPRGGTFLPNGDIVFAGAANAGLMRYRAIERSADAFTSLDAAAGESSHRFPVVAGGSHVIFLVRAVSNMRQGLWMARINQSAERVRLMGSESSAIVHDDQIIYARDGSLFAQGLTLGETPATSGRAVLLGAPAGRSPHDQVLAAAANDIVVFAPARSSLRELRWVSRQGIAAGTVGAPVDAWDVRIAPNGNRVAVTQADGQLGTLDIWAYDGDRPIPRRISPGIDADEFVVWARDGTRLAWVSGRRTVMVRGAMAELREDAVRKFDSAVRLSDWSPDQRTLIVTQTAPDTRDDIWLVPIADGTPAAYAARSFNEVHGVVSPDGRWLAYASDESGQFEIYLDAFPTPGRRGKLTSGGGLEPRWSGDGSEMFFRRGSEIHAVAVSFTAPTPEAAASTKLFDAPGDIRSYDVTLDGQRFLLNVPAPDSSPRAVSMVIHWKSLLVKSTGN